MGQTRILTYFLSVFVILFIVNENGSVSGEKTEPSTKMTLIRLANQARK